MTIQKLTENEELIINIIVNGDISRYLSRENSPIEIMEVEYSDVYKKVSNKFTKRAFRGEIGSLKKKGLICQINRLEDEKGNPAFFIQYPIGLTI